MQIRQLEGFSRVHSSPGYPIDGFSRVTYEDGELALGGLELQGCINRCRELDGHQDDDGYTINGLELQGIVQGYADMQMTPEELDEWEFLIDVEHPETMNGLKSWLQKRREKRATRQVNRRTRRGQKKSAKQQRRFNKRMERKEARAAREHKREQRRALRERRKAVRVARKEQRLKRKMLRAQSKADARAARSERPGFFAEASEAVKSFFNRDEQLPESDYLSNVMQDYGIPSDVSPEEFAAQLSTMPAEDVTEMYSGSEDVLDDQDKGYFIGKPPYEPWRGKWWGHKDVPIWQKVATGAGIVLVGDAALNQGKIRKSIIKAVTGKKRK